MKASTPALPVTSASKPAFHIRKKLFSGYDIVMSQPGRRPETIRRFCTRALAEYWLQVEAEAWTQRHAELFRQSLAA